MYEYFNPNPAGKNVGDCAVRAVSKALSADWDTAYALISSTGFAVCDMPSSDYVWGLTLKKHGFRKSIVPNTCPDCYTAADFAKDHPRGIYVLGFGGHTACVYNGVLYDSFDSSDLVPVYFLYRKDV